MKSGMGTFKQHGSSDNRLGNGQYFDTYAAIVATRKYIAYAGRLRFICSGFCELQLEMVSIFRKSPTAALECLLGRFAFEAITWSGYYEWWGTTSHGLVFAIEATPLTRREAF